MNCLDFHRAKLADPRRLTDEARLHVQACPECAAFASSVDEGERHLAEALASPVPDGLAERIILRSRARAPAWRAWAIAAGILLAVAAAFFYAGESRNAGDQYARLATEHV